MKTAFQLTPENVAQLAALCGVLDENIHTVARFLNVDIKRRGAFFEIEGENAANAEKALRFFYENLNALKNIGFHLKTLAFKEESPAFFLKKKAVCGKSAQQIAYLNAIAQHDLTFGIGAAGTGKTYLAVASAINALERREVERLILTRPAVEAGERLGFLPGDLTQKVDPYLRPLFDALHDFLGVEHASRLYEKGLIEIAPLAFMRGRTLNNAFIILDEAQNTTHEQMKMFLTRIGFGSKTVITGDLTQIDLPPKTLSGLKEALLILKNIPQIATIHFQPEDIMRHPLVAQIVKAYEKHHAQPAK